MIPRIGVEGYKYGKCLAESWVEPIRGRGMGKGRVLVEKQVVEGRGRSKRTYPSTPILGITSTFYAYENGTASKFRNVGTKSSDAERLPKRRNTAFNTRRKFEITIQWVWSDVSGKQASVAFSVSNTCWRTWKIYIRSTLTFPNCVTRNLNQYGYQGGVSEPFPI